MLSWTFESHFGICASQREVGLELSDLCFDLVEGVDIYIILVFGWLIVKNCAYFPMPKMIFVLVYYLV